MFTSNRQIESKDIPLKSHHAYRLYKGPVATSNVALTDAELNSRLHDLQIANLKISSSDLPTDLINRADKLYKSLYKLHHYMLKPLAEDKRVKKFHLNIHLIQTNYGQHLNDNDPLLKNFLNQAHKIFANLRLNNNALITFLNPTEIQELITPAIQAAHTLDIEKAILKIKLRFKTLPFKPLEILKQPEIRTQLFRESLRLYNLQKKIAKKSGIPDFLSKISMSQKKINHLIKFASPPQEDRKRLFKKVLHLIEYQQHLFKLDQLLYRLRNTKNNNLLLYVFREIRHTFYALITKLQHFKNHHSRRIIGILKRITLDCDLYEEHVNQAALGGVKSHHMLPSPCASLKIAPVLTETTSYTATRLKDMISDTIVTPKQIAATPIPSETAPALPQPLAQPNLTIFSPTCVTVPQILTPPARSPTLSRKDI